MTKWRNRRIILPLKKAIIKGVSAEKLSVSLVLGLTLGLIPVYGITTLLVGIIALSLRLNFVSMQLAHFIVQPLQLALLVPFFKLGNTLVNKTSSVLSVQQYINLFKSDFWGTLNDFWMVNLSAIVVWFIISIPMFFILYYPVKAVIGKFQLAHLHSKI